MKMNILTYIFVMTLFTCTSMCAERFFKAYAKNVQQEFDAKYGISRYENEKLTVDTYENLNQKQKEEMNILAASTRVLEPGKLIAGSSSSKKILCPKNNPFINTNNQNFKEGVEKESGKNYGKSTDPNQPCAEAEGRWRGVAAGLLFGPVNWIGLKVMCNSNNPQVAAGALFLTNALAIYNWKAKSSKVSAVCKTAHDTKRSFWMTIIISSTIALRIATASIN